MRLSSRCSLLLERISSSNKTRRPTTHWHPTTRRVINSCHWLARIDPTEASSYVSANMSNPSKDNDPPQRRNTGYPHRNPYSNALLDMGVTLPRTNDQGSPPPRMTTRLTLQAVLEAALRLLSEDTDEENADGGTQGPGSNPSGRGPGNHSSRSSQDGKPPQ
jgi:hypothetical protein